MRSTVCDDARLLVEAHVRLPQLPPLAAQDAPDLLDKPNIVS